METLESVREFFEANKTKPAFAGKSLKDVSSLSGGLINYVYRLEFDDGSTAVAKYYPRFLSSDKTVEMSQERYFVEKTALTLFHDQPWLRSTPTSRIRTPKVLFYDDAQFVLVMEDAGANSRTLLEHLKNNSDSGLISDAATLAHIAKDVSAFSKWLSSDACDIKWETHSNALENRPAQQIISGYVRRFCIQQSKRLGLESELEVYLKSLDKAFRPFELRDAAKLGEHEKRVFALGDLWPNSILVDRDHDRLWVIDWEMARFETRTSDIEQLMANLWVMKQSDIFNEASIDAFMKRLQFEFFGDESRDWRTNSGDHGRETFVLWITSLVSEKHWKIKDPRSIVLKAISEVKN